MTHALTQFVEPLESRRHLAAHAPAPTPQQAAEIDLGLVAAFVAAMSSAGASADPLAAQPANPGMDAVSVLDSPDGLDLLAGGSGNSVLSTPGTTADSVAASAPSPVSAD